jgi:hypothetical protein
MLGYTHARLYSCSAIPMLGYTAYSCSVLILRTRPNPNPDPDPDPNPDLNPNPSPNPSPHPSQALRAPWVAGAAAEAVVAAISRDEIDALESEEVRPTCTHSSVLIVVYA